MIGQLVDLPIYLNLSMLNYISAELFYICLTAGAWIEKCLSD